MTDDTNQPTSKNLEQSFKNLRTFIKDQHESLEKSHLRAIQHKTFTCAADCTSNYNLPHRQTSHCLEKCFDPFKKAEHLIKDCPKEADEDDEDINKKLAGMTCVKIEDVVLLAGLTLVKDFSYDSETSKNCDDLQKWRFGKWFLQ